MKRKYIILVILLVAGCNSTKLELTDNTTSNVAAVAAYIPAGTDSASAIKRMSDAGFICAIERGKTFELPKGTVVGQIGPVDIIWCDKQQGAPVAHRWQVILILDDKNKVKEHSVSHELVGP